jgi:hypothetical protein
MSNDIKLYEVWFDSAYPVPSGLLISASSKESALALAKITVSHKQRSPLTLDSIEEIKLDTEKVIFYESGEY